MAPPVNGAAFVQQLRRHTIAHYGQHRKHEGILADPKVIADLSAAIDRYIRRNPGWTGNDATLDALPMRRGPQWFRRAVAIPRCTNSLSLYLFLITDAVICIITLKFTRACFYKWFPDFMEYGVDSVWGSPGLGAFLSAQRRHLPFVVAICVTIVLVLLTFQLLHRFVSWTQGPHLLLTVVITLHLFAYTSLDYLIPDIQL